MEWISINDEIKPITEVAHIDATYRQSKNYPVKVAGFKEWQTGYYLEDFYGEGRWKIVGFHGDHEVTHWFDLPEPPKE